MAGGAMAGSMFGRYEIRRLLGVGGMGEVYEAYDTSKNRVVALKMLNRELAGDPTFVQRFRRESQAMASVQEPHVIPVHDWGEVDGVLYIDMRLVKGVDLKERLQQYGRLTPVEAVQVVEQIAFALDAAHEVGLVHRDVKPGNILLTGNLFAYLVDFGIAHTATDPQLTSAGSAVGSMAYMAPERFESVPMSPAVDTYALTCVLYECLVGRVPFPVNSLAGAIGSHQMAPAPRPSAADSSLATFDPVIERGMAKRPADRYASPVDLARAARNAVLLADRSTPPTVSGPRIPITGPQPTSSPASDPNSPPTTRGSAVVPADPNSPPTTRGSAVVSSDSSSPSAARGSAVVSSDSSSPPATRGSAGVPSGPPTVMRPAIVPSDLSSPPTTPGPAVVPSGPPTVMRPAVAPSDLSSPPTTRGLAVAPSGPPTVMGPAVVRADPPETRDSAAVSVDPNSPPETRGSTAAADPLSKHLAGSAAADSASPDHTGAGPVSPQSTRRVTGPHSAGSHATRRVTGPQPAGSQAAGRVTGPESAGSQAAGRVIGPEPAGSHSTRRVTGPKSQSYSATGSSPDHRVVAPDPARFQVTQQAPTGYTHPSAPLPLPSQRNSSTPVLAGALGALIVIAAVGAAVWIMLSVNDNQQVADRPPVTSGIALPPPDVVTVSQTVPTKTTVPPLQSSVYGADGQGFVSSGPRCNDNDAAMTIARTTKSRVVICHTGDQRYYYKGLRVSDGADLELDDPVPNGGGSFTATNPVDGTQYYLSASGFTITKAGVLLASEPVTEFAHR
ncbi:protein kinase [Nocardia sp. NPDC058705]|uniref:serine/threonine-protein kinase n=1 Tax=Nocardia sp. NPDC058705 TaxID=3346609 RepID=UPI0036ACC174